MSAPPARYVKTIDGYDIAYYVHGSGPTLVRVPVMWNHISRQWAPNYLGPFFDALAERFKLIAYDGRGQGLSTRGLPESLSLDDYVSDLEVVVDHLEPGRLVLFGMSAKAIVAIQYAVTHPERVAGLVLYNYGTIAPAPPR